MAKRRKAKRTRIGAALFSARTGKGWTQARAAAALGVAQPTYCVWEWGSTVPRSPRWPQIREVMGVRIERLA